MDIASLLIKHNTDVNATDRWLFTPLHEAAQKGRTQLCALLVSFLNVSCLVSLATLLLSYKFELKSEVLIPPRCRQFVHPDPENTGGVAMILKGVGMILCRY